MENRKKSGMTWRPPRTRTPKSSRYFKVPIGILRVCLLELFRNTGLAEIVQTVVLSGMTIYMPSR